MQSAYSDAYLSSRELRSETRGRTAGMNTDGTAGETPYPATEADGDEFTIRCERRYSCPSSSLCRPSIAGRRCDRDARSRLLDDRGRLLRDLGHECPGALRRFREHARRQARRLETRAVIRVRREDVRHAELRVELVAQIFAQIDRLERRTIDDEVRTTCSPHEEQTRSGFLPVAASTSSGPHEKSASTSRRPFSANR
jgi:hypothetical protein